MNDPEGPHSGGVGCGFKAKEQRIFRYSPNIGKADSTVISVDTKGEYTRCLDNVAVEKKKRKFTPALQEPMSFLTSAALNHAELAKRNSAVFFGVLYNFMLRNPMSGGLFSKITARRGMVTSLFTATVLHCSLGYRSPFISRVEGKAYNSMYSLVVTTQLLICRSESHDPSGYSMGVRFHIEIDEENLDL